MIDCHIHNNSYENICKDCNVLLCRICVAQHTRMNRDHSCYHIDEIRDSLNILDNSINNENDNKSNNNNNDITEDYFQDELFQIWNSIKSSSSHLNTLELKENEISDHFKQFHEYLIVEEHRLKSNIIKDIESIKQQTNQQINQLKSIIKIINLNTNSSNNDNEIKNNNKDKLQDEEELIDKTSQYSIETIIKTIQESSALNQFLKRNNKTIFNQQYQNNQDLLNGLNNDINLSILESIHNHKKLFKNKIETQLHQYTIAIDNQIIENAKLSIKQSIQLETNTNNYLGSVSTNKSWIINKPTRPITGIIFSTNKDVKIATLFDTNDNKVIDEIDFPHSTYYTFSTIVNVGEYVYIFGGTDMDDKVYYGKNKYIRYSIAEKKIDHRGTIDTIEFGGNISTCFDGDEYIYLVGGSNIFNNPSLLRIDRFNIKTMKFQKYYLNNNVNYTDIHSFFYNGVIFIIPSSLKKIYKFDPFSKDLSFDSNDDLFLDTQSACSDGNGNIYILSGNKQFIRYNVKSKKVDKLSPIISLEVTLQSMVFVHGRDGKSSRIYVFGGKRLKNHIYTLENNQWSSFYPKDSYDRTHCSSVLI